MMYEDVTEREQIGLGSTGDSLSVGGAPDQVRDKMTPKRELLQNKTMSVLSLSNQNA